MISRKQIATLLMIKKRRPLFFDALPKELIKKIYDTDYDQNPESEIAIALHHAAYARKEDVAALLALLDRNPTLLLQAGTVQTPGGDELRWVTLYEFLLGAGDYELASIVQGYFAKIHKGDQERIRQYERYRPHIESIFTQKAYDLKPLLELIKKSTPEQVKALLNKDMSGDDDLCNAFIQFRKDWGPKVITEPCMHYNYASLRHAFELFHHERINLYTTSNKNFDKIDLFLRQVIGFEMRRLPGSDRCMMAQGLYYVLDKKKPLARTYVFKHQVLGIKTFPETVADDSMDGLGWDFAVDTTVGIPLLSSVHEEGKFMGRTRYARVGVLMSNKKSKLAEHIQPEPSRLPSWCVLL